MTVDDPTRDRDDAAVAGATERPRRRWAMPRRPLALAAALLFFFGPLGALAFGQRPQEFENRPLAEFPSLSEGWSFFPKFTTWAVDHLPLRRQAVEANAAVSEQVFQEPPSTRSGSAGGSAAGVPSGDRDAVTAAAGADYPQVIQGEHGWLYLGADVSNLCDPERTVASTLERLDRLGRAIEASGRRFLITVAPDKTTVYPDALPEDFLGEECAAERRTAFWDALQQDPPTGYFDLRDDLEEEQAKSGPIYRPTDTHWAPRGAAIYARELARRLDPDLLDDTRVVGSGRASRQGDLGTLLGRPRVDEYPDVAVRRAGVVPVGREALDLPGLPVAQPVRATNRTTGAPLFEPPTLLLGDSFTNSSRATLGPFFADLTLLHNEAAVENPQVTADAVAAADVVVVEVVERTIASGRGALLRSDVLSAIEDALAASPR